MATQAENWGVEVEHLQLKNIDIGSGEMIRAMAKEAEAQRENRGKFGYAAMVSIDIKRRKWQGGKNSRRSNYDDSKGDRNI